MYELMKLLLFFHFFFFFQAEDGIRDFHVTGVQTCALPISESDIICTSSNAKKIVESIPKDQQILFAPDKNLGRWLIKETGRDMLLWQGSCIVHETFSQRRLIELKTKHPGAKIIAHPECEEPLLDMADFVGSTAALLRYVENDNADAFIVATESGILHQMQKRAPRKQLIPAPPEGNCACNEC